MSQPARQTATDALEHSHRALLSLAALVAVWVIFIFAVQEYTTGSNYPLSTGKAFGSRVVRCLLDLLACSAVVLSGGVDVMVDLDLNPWDAAASQVLVREAGGECALHPAPNGKVGLVLGSPPLVRELSSWLDP